MAANAASLSSGWPVGCWAGKFTINVLRVGAVSTGGRAAAFRCRSAKAAGTFGTQAATTTRWAPAICHHGENRESRYVERAGSIYTSEAGLGESEAPAARAMGLGWPPAGHQHLGRCGQ